MKIKYYGIRIPRTDLWYTKEGERLGKVMFGPMKKFKLWDRRSAAGHVMRGLKIPGEVVEVTCTFSIPEWE